MNDLNKKEYPSVQEMSDDQRIGIVKDIFASVTDKYDFLNRFLSGRRDVAWRKRTVSEMNFFNTNRFLDVATGTGDLALDCANTYSDVKVIGVDFVQEMVNNGLKKVDTQNLEHRVELKWGDATNIDFIDDTFDVTAIAFGIRNIPNKEKALSEMKRIIVPDGQIMVWNSPPQNQVFGGAHTVFISMAYCLNWQNGLRKILLHMSILQTPL